MCRTSTALVIVAGSLHVIPPATITVNPWEILEQQSRAVGMLGYGVSHFLYFSSHRNTLLLSLIMPLLFVCPPMANSCFFSVTVTRLNHLQAKCGRVDHWSLLESYIKGKIYPLPPRHPETYTFPSNSATLVAQNLTGRSAHCCHVNLRLFQKSLLLLFT